MSIVKVVLYLLEFCSDNTETECGPDRDLRLNVAPSATILSQSSVMAVVRAGMKMRAERRVLGGLEDSRMTAEVGSWNMKNMTALSARVI